MYSHHLLLPAAGVARGSQKTLRALVGRVSGGHAKFFVSRLLFALRDLVAHITCFVYLRAIINNNTHA